MPPTQTLFSFDFSEPFNCQKLFPFNSFLNIPQKIVYSDRRGSTPVSTVLRKQVRFFIINILLIIITIRIIRIRIRIRINLRRRRRGGIMIIIIIIIILIIIIMMINLSKLTGWKMVWTNVCLFVCLFFFFSISGHQIPAMNHKPTKEDFRENIQKSPWGACRQTPQKLAPSSLAQEIGQYLSQISA